MLPDLLETVKSLSQPTQLIKVETTIVNHRPSEVETPLNVRAAIQPAQKNKLNKDKIDWSLKYIMVHSYDQTIVIGDVPTLVSGEISISDYIVHKGIKYKAFENSDYNDYGFYETIMEEQK